MLKKFLARVLVVAITATTVFSNVSVAAGTSSNDSLIYLNSNKSVDERVKDLLGRMTLDEKIGQMVQAEKVGASTEDVVNYNIGSVLSGGGSLPATGNGIEDWAKLTNSYQEAAMSSRLGIPLLYGADAVHGHNNVYGTTIFPHNIGLGATGNTGLVKKIGQVTSEELRASGVNWTFAPTIGVLHNERWGRTYEIFGETSELVTKMGDAYIRGLQGDVPEKTLLYPNKVIATAKHYIGEGLATNGTNQGNVEMSAEDFEKVLREELLPPYEQAIKDGVRSVMISFNSVNGLKCHGNGYLINDILKGELGFTGIVISDYDGINQIKGPNGETLTFKEQVQISVNAGMDMLMSPGYWKSFIVDLKALISEGKVSEARINDSVNRILRVKFEMGLFEDPYAQKDLVAAVGSTEHREVARDAVRESLVLLKNNNDIVGQMKNKKNILVAGSAANDIGTQCGGWTISWQGSVGNITKGTTILQGIKDTVSSDTNISYNRNGIVSTDNLDVAIVVIGEQPYAETNGDRAASELKLSDADLKTISNIKEQHPNTPIVAVLVTGRPITIADQVEKFDGIIEAWLPGTEGQGVSDVLFGNYDFTGKLPVTWPWYASDIVNKKEEGKALFKFGYGLKKGETTELPSKPDVVDNKTYTTIASDSKSLLEAETFAATSITGQYLIETGDKKSGGKSIGSIATGSWLTYNVDVKADGKYNVVVKGASGDGVTGGAKLYSGSTLLTTIDIPKTGGWDTWLDSQPGVINLKAGKQELKFIAGKDGFNLDCMTLERVGDYEEPPIEVIPDIESQGNVIKQGAVSVTMSSSEGAQSMSWYDAPKELSNTLTQKESENITSIDSSKITTISLDPSDEHQAFLGMGTSLEESTINNLSKMNVEKRREFIKYLIDPVNGAGMTLMRVTVGTADFTSKDFYTYFDKAPKDINNPDWQNEFSIQKDIDYKIVDTIQMVIEEAKKLGIEDQIKFFASSWTPPGWMKEETSSSKSYSNNELLLKGGKLNSEHIDDLAKYYVRYLEEYAKLGINMYAMTLQNEPELEINYPSCGMTAEQEAKLAKSIKDEVEKSTILKDKGISPKLWAFDHNFSSAVNFMDTALANPDGMSSIDGVAFHDYGGVPATMAELQKKYPTKTMNLTERSVWGTVGADRITQYFRNDAESYNSWVSMLDSNIGTHHWVGTPDPTTFVQDANDPNNYWALPEAYISGQFSRFIRPGYVRVGSTYGSADTVTNVAFKDPKTEKIVMVVTNQTDKKQNFRIVSEGTQINGTIPAGNVATYEWTPVKDVQKIPATISATKYSNISTDGAKIDGDAKDYIGGLKNGSYLDYMIDVNEPGLYNVTYELATGINSDKSIEISQENKSLGKTEFNNDWSTSDNCTWAWSDFFTVQDTVKFDTTGAQSIRLAITQGEFNLKSIKFEKVEEVHNLPGKVAATNFIDSKGVITQGDVVGYFGNGDYVDYRVNVAESGTYRFKVNVATNKDDAALKVSSDGTDIGTFNLTNTTADSNYAIQEFDLALQAGEQTLRIAPTNDCNFKGFSIGSAITVTNGEIIEGAEDGKTINVELLDGSFNSSLDRANWTLENLPVGTEFEVAKVDSTHAIVTIKNNRSIDFDLDKTVKVKISSKELVGEDSKNYSIEDKFIIKAVDDVESISVDKESIPMGADSVTITVNGGNFINNGEILSGITLSGDASEYVSIKDFERVGGVNSTKIKLNLQWNGKQYYESLPLTINIPTSAYSDSNGGLDLTKEIICQGTTAEPTAITVSNAVVELKEADAYRNKGTLTSNVQIGNRVDYFLDVKSAGDYTISYVMNNNGGVTNGLKISGGEGFKTDNLASITVGNFWGADCKIKNTLSLKAGKQTLRFEANNTGFDMKSIKIEKKISPQVIKSHNVGDKTTISAASFFDGSKNVGYALQGSGDTTNIGCAVNGTFLDYSINVPKAGKYKISYNYSSGSSTVPVGVLQSVISGKVTTLGKTEFSNTGGWDGYKISKETGVSLEAGEQTLRVLVTVDGFNYRNFTLEYVQDKEAPIISGRDGVIEVGTPISETQLKKLLEIKAADNFDGDLTDKISVDFSKVDASKIGEYEVTASVSDTSGNKATTATFKIAVRADVTAPVISGKNIIIRVGAKFDALKDLGISVTDNLDGNLLSKAEITHVVDTSNAGVFRVKVAAVDNAGNKAEGIFVVRVMATGIINATDLTLYIGDKFNPVSGVKAMDLNGADITKSVTVVSNNVDTSKAGEYEVVYGLVDMENNIVQKSIKITVKDNSPSNPGEEPSNPGIPGTPETVIDENGNKIIVVSDIVDKDGTTIVQVVDAAKGITLEITDIDAIKNGTGSIQVSGDGITVKLPYSIIDKSLLEEGAKLVFKFTPEDGGDITKGIKGVKKVYGFTLSIVKGDKVTPITNFAAGEVEITLKLSDEEIKGVNSNNLGVFYYNENTKRFEYMETKVEGNKVTFKTPHFSKFIIAENNISGNGVRTPKTGDVNIIGLLAILATISLVSMIGIKKKKKV